MFSNKRKEQPARPLEGLEQARTTSLASFSPSRIRGRLGMARSFRKVGVQQDPRLHQSLRLIKSL
jgi:hypothetical protein